MINNVTMSPIYAPLFDPGISEIVEPSGRSTTKSTSNEIAAISLMTQHKHNNIWYCRAEKTDIRSTIFASTISTIQLLGLEKQFSWSLSPFEVACKTTGAKMYFGGINGKTDDDTTATKGFTPQFKTLAMCILDEADEVKHPNHIIAWESTANKFLLPFAKMVYAHNPPMSKSHWAVKFFSDKIRNGATRIYATWEDVRELLRPQTIAAIEKFKRDDPQYYRYWYLGEQVGFRGMVYPQFRRSKHIVNIYKLIQQNDRVVEIILGVDEGTIKDSTCVTVLAIMLSGRAVVLDVLEIDPQKIGQQAPTEQARRLKIFLSELLYKFPFMQWLKRRWIFECAEGGQMLKLQFEQDYGEGCLIVTQKSTMGDVKRIRSMLQEGMLLFHVDINVGTMTLIEDIENYVFDEKTNTIKKGQRDDTIDSLEYATKLYYDAPIATN
jgi:phage terminase large subunit